MVCPMHSLPVIAENVLNVSKEMLSHTPEGLGGRRVGSSDGTFVLGDTECQPLHILLLTAEQF